MNSHISFSNSVFSSDALPDTILSIYLDLGPAQKIRWLVFPRGWFCYLISLWNKNKNMFKNLKTLNANFFYFTNQHFLFLPIEMSFFRLFSVQNKKWKLLLYDSFKWLGLIAVVTFLRQQMKGSSWSHRQMDERGKKKPDFYYVLRV